MAKRITIEDLSPEFRRRAMEQFMEDTRKQEDRRKHSREERKGDSKYHNTPETVNGIRFASRREAGRYRELMDLQKAGKIRGLKLQRQFTLVEGFRDAETGKAVRALRYVADFVYEEFHGNDGPAYKTAYNASEPGEWRLVVEDAKGKPTRTYLDKKKLMLEKYEIRIRET